MTQEQKAKAYDKAVEKIKYVMEHGVSPVLNKEDLQDIFPQLKESEDEKIRKALISAINNICAGDEGLVTFNGFSKEQILAWLEKQGKHANFRNKIQIGDKVTRNDNGELVNLSQLERVAKKLEKQGEQKPAEEYNITGIGSKNARGKLGEMIKNLKPVNEVLEQKPAWGEEDEEMLRRCISATFDHGYLRECDWLKSLKDRVGCEVNCTTTKAWSEDDEINYNYALAACKYYGESKGYADTETHQKANNWLKSLKEKFVDFDKGFNVGFSAAKYNQWEPSDAQMASITCAVRKMKESACYDSELVSLYQDLKKLKG